MGMLKNGKWHKESEQADKEGRFVRETTKFRKHITENGSTGFKAEAGRYHLYVSYACPWASRALIMRKLKGLEDVISLSIVSPHMGENGWEFRDFPDTLPDTVNNSQYLWQVYLKADPDCSGHVTVPVLWDKKTNTIVNNESKEIMRMLDTQFSEFSQNKTDFYPESLSKEIDKTIDENYEPVNNGVYKAGFSTKQKIYEEAVNTLFEKLEEWERVLNARRYLCGDTLTEADITFFTTLYRFDPVYYIHFKCNLKRIIDYPNLWNYLKDVYQYPGISESCNLQHVKEHYYWSHNFINPHRIIPVGPDIDYNEPHNRDTI
jgi:putative glutathione S-transferase